MGAFDSRVRLAVGGATSPLGLEMGRSQPFSLTGRAARVNRTLFLTWTKTTKGGGEKSWDSLRTRNPGPAPGS